MSARHFNAGNVWGRVVDVKKDKSRNKVSYLTIQIDCSGVGRGNVRAYGRLWGKDRIEAFLENYKATPSQHVRMRGFFNQYKKGDQVHSNYTWYEWHPVKVEDQNPRAAFVLRGEILEVDTFTPAIRMRVFIPGKNGGSDSDETLQLKLRDADATFCEGHAGEMAEVKGYLMQGDGEDDFGDAVGNVFPVVMTGKVLGSF